MNYNKSPYTKFKADAVVLDAGAFPTNPDVLRIFDEGMPVVCCDGAANAYIASGRTPWRIVGDCDSLSPQLMEKYRNILHRIPEQETNDQTKSVHYLADHGYKKIAILGATGLREDHTLGNISLLVEYLHQGIEARIYTDYGRFIPVHNKIELEAQVGTQVSIFNFGATHMRAEGLKYPIRDFHNLWEGTLNETTRSTVKIEAKGYFLIFVCHPESIS